MSNNSFSRIAGIAGILSVLFMLATTLTLGPTGMPSGPLAQLLMVASILTGVVFIVGLYLLYRNEAAMFSLVAAAISLIGYLLFLITTLKAYDPNTPGFFIADILVFVVGLPLFSWLAYQSRKMPRPLAIVGFLAGLAGLGVYVLKFGAGADAGHPNAPLAGVASALYYLYFVLAFGWMAWTGYILLSGRAKTAKA